jgi:integrase
MTGRARKRRSWGSVRALRSGRFQVRYPDPETNRLVPAPGTFATRADADRWLAARRTDIERHVALDDRAALRPLRDWWQGYLRTVQASSKPSTQANYEQAWRLRVEPRFGAVSVGRIRTSHIEEWVTDLVSYGTSSSKIIESYGVLRRLLDRAVRDRAIAANPCTLRRAPLPSRPATNRPVLTPNEVEELATLMRRDDDRVLVRLLAYGGLRIGEAFALRRRDVDISGRRLTVRESVGEVSGRVIVGPTKTYAVRTITLPDSLTEELRGQLRRCPIQPSALVFGNRAGNHRRYRVFRRDSWDPAVQAMAARREATGRDLIAVTPHDLRATCASLLIDAGASVKDVQAHLGHKDITTTLNLYARVRPGRSTDLATRMDRLIAEGSASSGSF